RRLSELLWQPLAKHVPADTKTVYLAPDADLTGLPWAALPGRTPGKVLLEEHALAVVPHGPFLLERLQAKAPAVEAGDRLLALGAVRYDQTLKAAENPPEEVIVAQNKPRGGKQASWDYLQGTERELDQVLARAGKRPVTTLRGTEASIRQFLD